MQKTCGVAGIHSGQKLKDDSIKDSDIIPNIPVIQTIATTSEVTTTPETITISNYTERELRRLFFNNTLSKNKSSIPAIKAVIPPTENYPELILNLTNYKETDTTEVSTDSILKINNQNEHLLKDLEKNSEILKRVQEVINEKFDNKTRIDNFMFDDDTSNVQTIYHAAMVTLLGIAIGIFLAIIIAGMILYMTGTPRRFAKRERPVQDGKGNTQSSVHYLPQNEFFTHMQGN